MRLLIAAFLAGLALVLIARAHVSAAQLPPASPLDVTLTLAQGAYAPGVPLDLVIAVRNPSSQPVLVTFMNSQRFELIVESDVLEIDRWSRGQVFAAITGAQRWAPFETITYRVQWLPRSMFVPAQASEAPEQPIGRGVYRIHALLTGNEIRPASPAETLTIAPPTLLAAGCTTLPELLSVEMPATVLARTVEPQAALVSIWQRSVVSNELDGFSPLYLRSSDLRVLNRRFPITVCLAIDGTVAVP